MITAAEFRHGCCDLDTQPQDFSLDRTPDLGGGFEPVHQNQNR